MELVRSTLISGGDYLSTFILRAPVSHVLTTALCSFRPYAAWRQPREHNENKRPSERHATSAAALRTGPTASLLS
jgi:hypothetical protein